MTDDNGSRTNDIFGNKILNTVIILTAALLFAILFSSILNSPRDITITTCPSAIECPDYKNTVVEAQISGLNTRIDDLLNYVEYSNAFLGMIAAFFGGLITVVVIFFALRVERNALDKAKYEANIHIDSQFKKYDTLATRLEKQFRKIDTDIAKLNLNNGEEHPPKMDMKELEDRVVEAKNKPDHKKTAHDWRAIAWSNVESGIHIFETGRAFDNASLLSSLTAQKAIDKFNAAVSYGKANHINTAIETYRELISWGKDKDNPQVQEQVANAFSDLCVIYLEKYQSSTNEGERETFLKSAEEYIILAYAIKSSGAAYNFACLKAVQGKIPEAIAFLEESLAAKKLPNKEHIENDADHNPIRDTPEFKAFMEKAFPEGDGKEG